MKIQKLQAEFQKLKFLKGDDWITILAFTIAAISVMVYTNKIRDRVIEVMGQGVQNIIEQAEKVAREAQEIEA